MAEATNSMKPSEFDDNKEKLSEKYGLAYARYIDSQHYRKKSFISARKEMEENELYRSGLQSNENVMKYLLDGRDKSYGKLNFVPHNVIPKYVKLAKKNLGVDLFEPKVTAIDSTSVSERDMERDELIDRMINGSLTSKMSQMTGVDFTPKGFIPQDKSDIDVYMETESTLPQEIAMEQALAAVHEANYHREIKDRLVDDLITNGIAVVKDDYDPQLGVVTKRVSPITYISSYDGSEMNDNRGSFYDGHIEMMSLIDLQRVYGMKKEDGIEFCKTGSTRQENIQKWTNKSKWEDINNTMVRVLFFEFRTTLTETYKKKKRKNNRISVERKDSSYNFNKGNVETLHRTKEVWIEGAWVVDSNIMLNYGVRNNMVVDSLKKVRSSYSSYDTNEMSLVRKCIPYADNIGLAIVKMNQMIASARPKGIAINISTLLDLPNPDGGEGKMSYLNLVRRFNETGNQLYKMDEFSAGQGIPITELENGLPNDIGKYIEIYNHNLKQIHDTIGMNPQMAGMGAASRVSTESNNIAMQSSVKAIEFIKDGILSMEKRLAENIIIRIQDIDRFGEKPFKKYVQALGMHNMDALNKMKGLHPYTFSLRIDMLPDVEERQELNADLAVAIQSGQITISDKMDVNNITNLKLASAVLKRRIKENEEKRQQLEMQRIQAQQQADMAKLQADDMKLQKEYSYKSELSAQEHYQKMEELRMQIGMKQQDNVAQETMKFEKEMRDKAHENSKVVYQEQEKKDRQKDNQEFLKQKDSEGGKTDSEKNMTKVGLKK